MKLKDKIKSNPFLKKLFLWLLIPSNDFRPRWWIRVFVNRLKHKRGKSSIIRRFSRMDVFPFNKFSLGAKSIIEDFSVINNAVGEVNIGDNTIIGIGSVVIGPIDIGNNVMFAQHVVASGLNHGYKNVNISPSKQKVECSKIIIEDDVWIGANAVITSGITLGKHSIIGAGSVVTKNVPPYSVVVGNPAKIIKRYNSDKQEWESCKQENL